MSLHKSVTWVGHAPYTTAVGSSNVESCFVFMILESKSQPLATYIFESIGKHWSCVYISNL